MIIIYVVFYKKIMFIKTMKNDEKITSPEISEKIDLDFLKSNNQHNQTTE